VKLPHKKSRVQRLLETANPLDLAGRAKSKLPSGGGNALTAHLPKSKDLKARLPQGKALTAGLIASGLAGLTAGSAGISSLRRRRQEARSDS
jgi:hypothetical protein